MSALTLPVPLGEVLPAAWAVERTGPDTFAGPLAPPLLPMQAAEAFVEWYRAHCDFRPMSSRLVVAHYLEHCEVEGRQPVPEQLFVEALRRVHGVVKKMSRVEKRGRIHRPIVWTIEPAEAAPAATALPVRSASARLAAKRAARPERERLAA